MIEDAINKERYNFALETGKHPTKLYLGWETYRNLMIEIEPMLTHKIDLVTAQRAQCYGMDIYRVDAKEYLAVSI